MKALVLVAVLFTSSTYAIDQEELLAHYSPVILQGIGAYPRGDYITRFDYDGDLDGSNNWENFPTAKLEGYVYGSAIETDTHFFLTYAIFHPRDYIRFCVPKACHENDLEGIKLSIYKDGSAHGVLRLMETIAHQWILPFGSQEMIKKNKGKLQGEVLYEGSHPIIYIEKEGHGIHAATATQIALRSQYLVYRNSEEEPTEPGWPKERQASYNLLPLYEHFWKVFEDTQNNTFGSFFRFVHPRSGAIVTVPSTLKGNNYARNAANLPWNWGQNEHPDLKQGEWFLDPAKSLIINYMVPETVARTYVHNEFLDSML